MAIKKYTNGSWASTSYRKYGTETDAITTLPTTVIGDGTPISSYTIKGNMEQSGTPTPSSPIYPSECGERTENLFDGSSTISGMSSPVRAMFNTLAANIDFKPNMQYSLRIKTDTMSNAGVFKVTFTYSDNTTDKTGYITKNVSSVSLTSKPEKTVASLSITDYNAYVDITLSEIMVVEGSTPLPYEPYGYKLPITLGGTTTNIYLGEAQTTRRIKKLVLTGEELWTTYLTSYFITVNDYYRMYDVGSHLSVCSHYPIVQKINLPEMHYGLGGLIDGQTYTRWNGNIVFNPSPTISSRTDWQSYLAQQYANGTPVTVWYVLAEPETGIVNEPIRKIGDYVDSVSGTNLATSGTAQELDVGTTLKPSEVDLTYHGWHKHDDTKYST